MNIKEYDKLFEKADQLLPKKCDEKDPVAPVTISVLFSKARWHLMEYDGEDTYYGLAEIFEKELGYISKSELRDLCKDRILVFEFAPRKLSELES